MSDRRPEFKIIKKCKETKARLGKLETPHGPVETPTFMPVGTQGTVKTLSSEELREIGLQIFTCNSYHLYLRPGEELIAQAGGLHKFINWERALLTDSGGYQIFSLEPLREISQEGISFQSHLDGKRHFFTPEKIIEVQEKVGADIIMTLDECINYPAGYEEAKRAAERTLSWAKRCKRRHKKPDQALFGIIQGGTYQDLRQYSAEGIVELEFDGYAIGGLSVGEPKELMYEVLEYTVPLMPEDKPRYLMGVGPPEDIFEAIERGIDMFDCVLPTRLARNGTVYTSFGRFSLKNAQYFDDFTPIDPDCPCYTCRSYSKAYLRHLFKSEEILAPRLTTYHNVFFFVKLLENIRRAIAEDSLFEFKRRFLEKYQERMENI